LAGYQVAKSFNNMGFGIMEMNNIIGYVGGALVIFMGHALNIALCIMGVLVHGIRLNTLEFSGHLNLEWAGVAFKPFKKLKTNNN
jgi:V/A-type H+-transporting ATPase subunit I